MILPDFLTKDADDSIHVTGHRIGLEHLVYYYEEGYSPEMLASEYPSLSLAAIHKVIAFFLENRVQVEAYISRCKTQLQTLKSSANKGPSLAELRQRMATSLGSNGPS